MEAGLVYYITNKKELKQLLKQKQIIVLDILPKRKHWWEFWNIGKIESWKILFLKK